MQLGICEERHICAALHEKRQISRELDDISHALLVINGNAAAGYVLALPGRSIDFDANISKFLGLPAPFVVGPAVSVSAGEELAHSSVLQSIGEVWLDRDGPFEARQCLVETPQPRKHNGAIV